jgi:hypothetical protein
MVDIGRRSKYAGRWEPPGVFIGQGALQEMFLLVTAVAAFLAVAPVQDGPRAPDPAHMSREERIRVLRQRVWEVTAFPIRGGLRLDGRLDEAEWDEAAPIADFYQRERNEGLPATERTEVRVLYDATSLYIGFRCFDSRPEKVRARAMFRDESGTAEDLVSIMLDAYNDHRSAIQLVTNANGLMEDLLQTGESRETRDANWDAVWYARGSRNARGWEAEVAVPFRSLRFESPADGGEVVFGIGFKRNIPRKNEEVYWPFVPNDSSWYRPGELGHLRGLRGITPGRSAELRPYVLGGAKYDGARGGTDGRSEAGLDFKWGINSGLTADFTFNTDFAQEEADIQQINLTRFSLFFPEKRQFFLEGERMFQFGIPKEAELVFTRRIGLSENGEVIPVAGGARLTGRQGRYGIGAMSIQTASEQGRPSENFTVVRVRRDVLSRSSVGALFAGRQGGGRSDRVAGADMSFFVRDAWIGEAFWARRFASDISAGTHGGYARFGYERDRWGANYRYSDFGENFTPGTGYVRRPDSRSNSADLRFSPRPNLEAVRQFSLGTSVTYVTNQRNVLETRSREAHFAAIFESGDILTFTFDNQLESIARPFLLRRDVAIPPGAYRFNTFTSRFESFSRRYARVKLSYVTGGFWSGERDSISAEPIWRVHRNLDLSGSYKVDWIRLPQGRFTTQLVTSRVVFVLRNNMALNTLCQYNSDTRQFSTYARFRWIFKPGSDFFVVYSETDERSGFFSGVRNRALTIKLNYLFAF